MSGLPKKRRATYEIVSSSSKKQRPIDAAKALLDIANESAEAFPPLKSCLGAIYGIIRPYEENKVVGDMLRGLMPWLTKLKDGMMPITTDGNRMESKRRGELTRSLEAIEKRSTALSYRMTAARVLDKTQDPGVVIKLLEQLRQAAITYQLSQQLSIHTQVEQLTSSFNTFLEHRKKAPLVKGKIESTLAWLGRLRVEDITIRDEDEPRRQKALFEILEGIKDDLQRLFESSSDAGYKESNTDILHVCGLAESARDTVIEYQYSQQKALLEQNRKLADTAELLALNGHHRARGAGYSDGNRNSCHQGTREDVLNEIECWAEDFEKPPVFWLNGTAGTGKSTIAQTIAERLFAKGRLGASFFCSRDSEDRRNLQLLFPTLAFQLAQQYPAVRSSLVLLLQHNPDIALEPLLAQMDKLMIGPLQSQADISMVIVIDALDECNDENTESTILPVLGQFITDIPRVKFFITSRPETHITTGFRTLESRGLLDVSILHDNWTASGNDRIDVLDRIADEVPPLRTVFRAVGAILTLVKEQKIGDKDSIQLTEYCFSMCEALKTAIYGEEADNLPQSVKAALKDAERTTREIDWILRRGEDTQSKRHKQKIEKHVREIEQILSDLNSLRSPRGESPSVVETSSSMMSIDLQDDTTTSVAESACKRLIRREFALHELNPLIDAILSNQDELETIRSLLLDDAQALINVMDETLDMRNLLPWTQRGCLKLLYKTCGHHALLPEALKVPVHYDQTRDALFRGGYADVYKGKCCGQEVAVKVIRTYSTDELRKVINWFCKEAVMWRFLRHANVLPLAGVVMSENRFAMVSGWMTNGSIIEFVTEHPNVDRLELLAGVTKGLIYLHNNGMIHGDLKGANILIDENHNARLADFGLLTIVSDPANLLSSSSNAQGGTLRWMSPELIVPEKFGLEKSCPTESSDCYALGMVIYETIGGNVPFYECQDMSVPIKVIQGERPTRGEMFSENLWKMLELCWAFQPKDRPSIEDVLQCLQMVASSPGPDPQEDLQNDGVGLAIRQP